MAEQLYTALDIGTSKIAVLIAKLTEEDKEPRVMGFASVASRGVKRGQIVDIRQVTTAIEECVEKAERMAGFKISSALVTVSGPHITSLNSHGVVAVSAPEAEITTTDIDRAIDAAKAISLSGTREVIDVLPREFIVDGQSGIKNPAGMSGVRLEVNTHIITASATNLKNIDRALSDLGIACDGYVFSGLASSMAVVSDTEKELGVVLVDIGGGKTDVCIFVEGALAYSSSIAIGARHLTNDIAVGLRLSLESAEKIKLFMVDKKNRKKSTTKNDDEKKDDIDVSGLNLSEGTTTVSYKTVVEGIMRPRLEEIFEKVYEEIEKSEYTTHVPSGLVLCGGGALSIGALDVSKHVVGMTSRIGLPGNITGLVDEVMYPQFAAVVGLLLYAKQEEKTKERINLKDFNQIFRNVSLKGSVKKMSDLIKSLIP